MSLTFREFWTLSHGMILGALFLLTFLDAFAGLYFLRPAYVTAADLKQRVWRLKWGAGAVATFAWLLVISGTYVVYPWYRATPPEGATDLSAYPRSFLRSDPSLSSLHTFGMEWKEHVAWFAPLLATTVFYIVLQYGPQLLENNRLRKMALILFVVSFATAGIAGVLGVLVTNAAPVR